MLYATEVPATLCVMEKVYRIAISIMIQTVIQKIDAILHGGAGCKKRKVKLIIDEIEPHPVIYNVTAVYTFTLACYFPRNPASFRPYPPYARFAVAIKWVRFQGKVWRPNGVHAVILAAGHISSHTWRASIVTLVFNVIVALGGSRGA